MGGNMSKHFFAAAAGVCWGLMVTTASAHDFTKPDATAFVDVPANVGWEVQTLLFEVGCLSRPGTDGKWGESSATDFRGFLSKTDQLRKYDPKQTVAQVG